MAAIDFVNVLNSQPVHCLSAEIRSLSAQSNIIFAPKPCIYYQNICILPRKIPINIQITASAQSDQSLHCALNG